MDRSTTVSWVAALVAVAVALAVAVAGYRLAPCAVEDGGPYPCVWDGPSRGNHQGRTVIITADD